MKTRYSLKEVKRFHYYIQENAIYSVQVIKRDGDNVASYCQVPGTKKIIKEFPDQNQAIKTMQTLSKTLGSEVLRSEQIKTCCEDFAEV